MKTMILALIKKYLTVETLMYLLKSEVGKYLVSQLFDKVDEAAKKSDTPIDNKAAECARKVVADELWGPDDDF